MIPKDIIIAALKHTETPQTPYHLDFTPPVKAMLQQYFRVEDVDDALGNYLRWVSWHPSLDFLGKRHRDGMIEDEYGVVWLLIPENRGYPVFHPLKKADLSNYQFPDSYAPGRFAGAAEKIQRYRNHFVVAWCGDFFERAHFLRGLDNILVDLYEHPQFVHDLLDGILAFNLSNIEQLSQFSLDGIFLSDDYGHQQGLLMSPIQWREFIKPRLHTLIQKVKGKGLYVFLHSCGNVTEIVPDLIEIGLDVLHPIQPEAMDIAWLKKQYGQQLTFYGGISTQRTLIHSSAEEVKREVRTTIQQTAKGGGYILGPGITLQHDVPLENILALIPNIDKPDFASIHDKNPPRPAP